MEEQIERIEIYEAIIAGLEDEKAGRAVDGETVLQELKDKYNL